MSPAVVFAPERWRKPVSFVFAATWLAIALLIVPRGFATGWFEALELVGFVLLIIAALGRIWAFTYICGRKNIELCCKGPYSLTRNPLYLFSFLGVCGASLALQSLMLFAGSAVFFLAYYAWVIRAEEKRLAVLFSPGFATYCRDVPRFWPRLARPDPGEDITVSPRLVARHLTEGFWFLAAIVFIELIEMGKVGQWWATIHTRF